jgi:hypothetical protein
VRTSLAHFAMNGERGKGKRHHKGHGKDDRVQVAIISHIGQMQQFCYIHVTLSCPLLVDMARDMPVVEEMAGLLCLVETDEH